MGITRKLLGLSTLNVNIPIISSNLNPQEQVWKGTRKAIRKEILMKTPSKAFIDQVKGRIAIFYPYSWSLPALEDAANMFGEAGFLVDIYSISKEDTGSWSFVHNNVKSQPGFEHLFPYSRISPLPFLQRKGEKYYLPMVQKIYRPLLRKYHFSRIFESIQKSTPYTLVIGFDAEGLVVANYVAHMFGIPIIYWSLEVIFSDDYGLPNHRALKPQEKKVNKTVAFTIIQDKWRADLLKRANELGDQYKQFVFVPNARRGQARRAPHQLLRNKLGIPADKKIVLYTGMLTWSAMLPELIESTKKWPDEFVLVINARYPMDNSEYRRIDIPKVFWSLSPCPRSQYREMVDSADIGIALYESKLRRPDNHIHTYLNIATMGLSSGKISDYLQSGLPVITNKLIGTSEFIATYGCGISIDTPQGIGLALDMIGKNYSEYSQNACRAFNDGLEFERYFHSVVQKIKEWT